MWTCASKNYKDKERKTRQVAASQQKVQDAITERQRQAAERTANAKRRHDVRDCYKYSLCSRTRLLEVNMLGSAVRIDGTLHVACCACLAYTAGALAYWYGDALICARCWDKTHKGAQTALGVLGSSTAVKCRKCKRIRRPGDAFYRTTVLADQTMRFVDIWFCHKHVEKKSWLFGSPNLQSLSTVEVGLKASWATLRDWDMRRDYLRTMLLANETDAFLNDEGIDVFAPDDLDDDDDDGEDDEEEEEVSMPAPKARRMGTARGRLTAALKNA